MSSELDVLGDLGQKKKLLQPPVLDLGHCRTLADEHSSNRVWIEKLEFASTLPFALTETEFHYYELYKPEVTHIDIQSYVGKALQIDLHDRCNSPLWVATSGDKALFELVLKGANLPVAQTQAILSRSPRSGFSHQLTSIDKLRDFLLGEALPIFCKPIDGMFGIGTFKIDAFSNDLVFLAQRMPVTLGEFYKYLTTFSLQGYLFQSLIEQTRTQAELFGNAVSTIRFLVFNSDRPRVISAVLRIPTANAIADNFWQPGNILAAIDVETGQISSAMQNSGHAFLPVTAVPPSNFSILGYQIEDWDSAIQLALQAAALFPMVGTQSWDVAISINGPVAIEYNWGGDLNIHQLANGRGLYDELYRDHVARCQR